MSKKSSFSVNKASESPGLLLWQSTTLWQRLIKNGLEPYNISHSQFVIMAILCWFNEKKLKATQIKLAEWSKLDKMTISKALKNLILEKLIIRHECPDDSRAKVVMLTEKGKTLIHKLIKIVEKIDYDFFKTFNQNEQKDFIKLLSKILENSHTIESPM